MKEVIDILESCLADWWHGATKVYSIMKRIEQSVELLKEQPPKKGEWIIDEYGIHHCPFCKAINETVYQSFCPNCGADMRKGGEQIKEPIDNAPTVEHSQFEYEAAIEALEHDIAYEQTFNPEDGSM